MNNVVPSFLALSSFISALALFFPVVLPRGEHAQIISLWIFSEQHPIGLLILFLYLASAVASYFGSTRTRILAGTLHSTAVMITLYIIFAFSNVDADIPNKYIVTMAAVFILPLAAIPFFFVQKPVGRNQEYIAHDKENEMNSEYSALQIANAFAELLKISDQSVISDERLVFQRDALERLGDEEGIESGPFATFVYDKVEQDTAFAFTFLFFRDGFQCVLADMITFTYSYSLFGTDQEAAKQIYLVTLLLLNGQIELALSYSRNQLYAFETLLYKHNRLHRTVIDTQAHFPRLLPLKESGVQILRNTAADGFFEIGNDFFMNRLKEDGYFPISGRELESGEVPQALSRKEYKQLLVDQMWTGTGAPLGTNPWWHIYAQWEFWAITSAIYGVIAILYFTHLIKDNRVFEHPALYTVPIYIIVTGVMPTVLRRKERHKHQV